MAAQYSWPWDGNEMYIRGEWIYRDSQFSTIEDTTYLQTSGVPVLRQTRLMPASRG